MVTVNDPLFVQQWHFKLLGNIQKIWDEYTGRGIHVGVYDDGLQYTHPDLDANYAASLRFSDGGLVYDPYPISLVTDNHGTSVSGIIAAEANNGIGGVGVAFNAKLTGVSILGDTRFDTDYLTQQSFLYAATFDIMSNSWGYDPIFSTYENAADPYSNASTIISYYDHAVSTGRSGLGTVIVQAAGNESSNANADGINAARQIISVAALTPDGSAEDYSNYGANILISAGAAAVTTDLRGNVGYNTSAGVAGDYTSDFGGTSAATPVISGVVALMLDANEALGWRDVKDILANTAKMTGSIAGGAGTYETTGTSFQNIDRSGVNGLVRNTDSWNDGGRAISWAYGYGRADAFAAVRLAEVWTQIHGPAQTSDNERHISLTDATDTSLAYTATSGTAAASVSVTGHMSVEYVSVSMNFSYYDLNMKTSGLTFSLYGPGGAGYKLVRGSELYYDDISGNFSWRFGVSQAMGLDAQGTWTLRVTDSAGAAAGHFGTLGDVTFDFYGADFSLNNIHYITQDFLLANSKNAGGLRDKAINDTNGGTDWLEMATLSGNVVASLEQGASFSVNGVVWGKIASGTVLENLVTGDGADRLTGNAVANNLMGMRGNDVLSGAAGNDTLNGGVGNDFLKGGDGNDTALGAIGNDSVFGSAGNDYLSGGAGNDTVDGGAGQDQLDGNSGRDTLTGGADADTFFFRNGAGNDLVTDFANNIDTIRIDDLLWGGAILTIANVLADFASVSGGNVVLNFGSGNVLTIAHLTSINALLDDITII